MMSIDECCLFILKQCITNEKVVQEGNLFEISWNQEAETCDILTQSMFSGKNMFLQL